MTLALLIIVASILSTIIALVVIGCLRRAWRWLRRSRVVPDQHEMLTADWEKRS